MSKSQAFKQIIREKKNIGFQMTELPDERLMNIGMPNLYPTRVIKQTNQNPQAETSISSVCGNMHVQTNFTQTEGLAFVRITDANIDLKTTNCNFHQITVSTFNKSNMVVKPEIITYQVVPNSAVIVVYHDKICDITLVDEHGQPNTGTMEELTNMVKNIGKSKSGDNKKTEDTHGTALSEWFTVVGNDVEFTVRWSDGAIVDKWCEICTNASGERYFIFSFDVEEWRLYHDVTENPGSIDYLDIGFWYKINLISPAQHWNPPNGDYRQNMKIQPPPQRDNSCTTAMKSLLNKIGKAYGNGNSFGTKTGVQGNIPINSIGEGDAASYDKELNGSIGKVAFYNRALSEDEVKAIYKAGMPQDMSDSYNEGSPSNRNRPQLNSKNEDLNDVQKKQEEAFQIITDGMPLYGKGAPLGVDTEIDHTSLSLLDKIKVDFADDCRSLRENIREEIEKWCHLRMFHQLFVSDTWPPNMNVDEEELEKLADRIMADALNQVEPPESIEGWDDYQEEIMDFVSDVLELMFSQQKKNE